MIAVQLSHVTVVDKYNWISPPADHPMFSNCTIFLSKEFVRSGHMFSVFAFLSVNLPIFQTVDCFRMSSSIHFGFKRNLHIRHMFRGPCSINYYWKRFCYLPLLFMVMNEERGSETYEFRSLIHSDIIVSKFIQMQIIEPFMLVVTTK